MAVLHAAAAAAGQPLYAHLLGDRPAVLPTAGDPDFRRRRACRAARRHPGFHGRGAESQEFRPGAGLDRRGLSRGRRHDGARRGRLQGVADEGGYLAGLRFATKPRSTLWSAPSSAPASRPATRWRSRSTSPRPNSTATGAYRLALEERALDSDAMAAMLIGWLDRYPIVSIEDPLAEDDAAGLRRFTEAAGHRVQIVGDDFLVTDAARLRARGRHAGLQRRPGQAEPGRHGERGQGRGRRRARRAAGAPSYPRARARPRT